MMDDTVRQRVIEAVLGDPDPERDRRLREELAASPELRDEYETLKELWHLLGELPAPNPPDGARHRAEAAAANALTAAANARSRLSVARSLVRIAAGLAIFVTGAAAGAAWASRTEVSVETALPDIDSPAPVAERPLFAFIVRGEPTAGDGGMELAMTGFARDLWSDDRLVWAERLSPDSSAWVRADGEPPPAAVPGAARLFMVRANDRDEAIRLARRAPHLAGGGVIEILRSATSPGG